ncbi:palindromic element RPE4 domain-containing protein [Rickettsia sp.]
MSYRGLTTVSRNIKKRLDSVVKPRSDIKRQLRNVT